MNLRNNPEFIPLVEWWEKDGKQTVIMLAIAAIAVGGWYGWKNHRAAAKAAASASVANSVTTEDLEAAVSRFGGSDAAGALKIRLAKSYYDAGRYDAALAEYEKLDANPPDGFADIPKVGKAQCLEALGKFDDACKAFDAFAAADTNSFLALTAKLGAVRCLCQLGDKNAALDRVKDLKVAYAEDEIAKTRIEAVETAVNRFVKK